MEYYAKAAELGNADAHCLLGMLYRAGQGVEKDMKRAVYHWEQAAIGGHAGARGHLGFHDMENGMFERASKHFSLEPTSDVIITWNLLKISSDRG